MSSEMFDPGPLHSTPVKEGMGKMSRFEMDSVMSSFGCELGEAVPGHAGANSSPPTPRHVATPQPHSSAAGNTDSMDAIQHEASIRSHRTLVQDVEQSLVARQQQEIQVLLSELKARDRELNETVASHHHQLAVWERDKQLILRLQHTCHHLAADLEQQKQLVSRYQRQVIPSDCDSSHQSSSYDGQIAGAMKHLLSVRGQLEDQVEELNAQLKLKDASLAEAHRNTEELRAKLKLIEIQTEDTQAASERLVVYWQKCCTNLKEEKDKLLRACQEKDKQLHKATSQLQDALQQALVSQQALCVSCEREKTKDEVISSLRCQQERCSLELNHLRQLYRQQHREVTLLQLTADTSRSLHSGEVDVSNDLALNTSHSTNSSGNRPISTNITQHHPASQPSHHQHLQRNLIGCEKRSNSLHLTDQGWRSNSLHLTDQGQRSNSLHLTDQEQRSNSLHLTDQGQRSNSLHLTDQGQRSNSLHLTDQGQRSNSLHLTDQGQRSNSLLMTDQGQRSNSLLMTDQGQRSNSLHLTDQGQRSNSLQMTDQGQRSNSLHLTDQGQRSNSLQMTDQGQRSNSLHLTDQGQRSNSLHLTDQGQRSNSLHLTDQGQRSNSLQMTDQGQRSNSLHLADQGQRSNSLLMTDTNTVTGQNDADRNLRPQYHSVPKYNIESGCPVTKLSSADLKNISSDLHAEPCVGQCVPSVAKPRSDHICPHQSQDSQHSDGTHSRTACQEMPSKDNSAVKDLDVDTEAFWQKILLSRRGNENSPSDVKDSGSLSTKCWLTQTEPSDMDGGDHLAVTGSRPLDTWPTNRQHPGQQLHTQGLPGTDTNKVIRRSGGHARHMRIESFTTSVGQSGGAGSLNTEQSGDVCSPSVTFDDSNSHFTDRSDHEHYKDIGLEIPTAQDRVTGDAGSTQLAPGVQKEETLPTTVGFEEKLSSFLETPDDEDGADPSNSYSLGCSSPASKLHRLLMESQEMLKSLESTVQPNLH